MLHIRPVEEKDASSAVKGVYGDIKQTLNIHFIPLLFQYIAGYEEYFLYAWEKYKANLQSGYYAKATDEVLLKTRTSIRAIYKESRALYDFVRQLDGGEKKHVQETVDQLETLNAQLLILSIGLREGVKGVTIGQQMLPRYAGDYGETVFDQFINQQIMHANLREEVKDIAPGMRMLAPLFGSHALVVTHYPEFFSHIAGEMEHLGATERYLHERVQLEHTALTAALNQPYPLGCSYLEIAQFAGKKPYFSELLYVLSETFPTQFPRLLFTSSLMQFVLGDKKIPQK